MRWLPWSPLVSMLVAMLLAPDALAEEGRPLIAPPGTTTSGEQGLSSNEQVDPATNASGTAGAPSAPPASPSPEDEQPPADEHVAEAQLRAEPSASAGPLVPTTISRAVVVWAREIEGLSPGELLVGRRDLDVSASGGARFLLDDRIVLAIVGPARMTFRPDGQGLAVEIQSGRGVLWAERPGLALSVGGHRVGLAWGILLLDGEGGSVARLVSGSASVDGVALAAAPANARSDVIEIDRASQPPAPQVIVPLGDPGALTSELDRARASGGEDSAEGATAEASATCVDSASTGAASDPTTGPNDGVDPDARQHREGTVRVHIRLPER